MIPDPGDVLAVYRLDMAYQPVADKTHEVVNLQGAGRALIPVGEHLLDHGAVDLLMIRQAREPGAPHQVFLETEVLPGVGGQLIDYRRHRLQAAALFHDL